MGGTCLAARCLGACDVARWRGQVGDLRCAAPSLTRPVPAGRSRARPRRPAAWVSVRHQRPPGRVASAAPSVRQVPASAPGRTRPPRGLRAQPAGQGHGQVDRASQPGAVSGGRGGQAQQQGDVDLGAELVERASPSAPVSLRLRASAG